MNKNKLLKGLASLALIFVICFMASKLLFGSSETLREYAQKNPDVAYADTSSESSTKANTNVSSGDLEEKETILYPMVEADSDFVNLDDGFYYGNLSSALKKRITGISYPLTEAEISYSDLRYLHVLHYDFDGEIQEGELICNKAIVKDLSDIFSALYKAEYQLEKMKLIDEYLGDDDASMTDNNTSCFNYRVVENTTKLSKHAYGLAVDVNPFYNPYVRYNKDGSQHIDPKGSEAYADRSIQFPYKIDYDDLCYRLFTEKGFTWGGDWNSAKDYQHFQITLSDTESN